MRLSVDQIKQGLCHDDLNVRDRSLRTLTGILSDDTSIMNIVTPVIDARGAGAFKFFHDIGSLAQDDATIDWVVRSLRECPVFFQDRKVVDFRLGILVDARGELLQRHREDVMSVLPHHEQEAVIRRLAYLSESPADLWDQLRNLCEEFALPAKWPDFPHNKASDMVVTIAERGGVPIDRLMELLQIECSDDDDAAMVCLEPYLVQLAGLMRHEPALPILIEKLRIDGDYLNEASKNALIRLGTDTVVRTIAELLPDEEWHWQLYASAVFEDVHSEESIRAATELLQIESIDEGIRQNVAHGLANQYSTEGLDVLDAYLGAHTDWLDNPEWTETIPLMQASATLLGLDPSRFDRWKVLIEEACESGQATVFGSRIYDEDDFEDDEDDVFHIENCRPLPETTFVSVEPHVGRNDPCPCRSGKKFKKCCMGK